jgi:hypothetical protein
MARNNNQDEEREERIKALMERAQKLQRADGERRAAAKAAKKATKARTRKRPNKK